MYDVIENAVFIVSEVKQESQLPLSKITWQLTLESRNAVPCMRVYKYIGGSGQTDIHAQMDAIAIARTEHLHSRRPVKTDSISDNNFNKLKRTFIILRRER